MQEITVALGSLVGIATAAVAIRGNRKDSPTAVPAQARQLVIERDILSKTITRLYSEETHLPEDTKDKLLTKYQQQLAAVLAQIDRIHKEGSNAEMGHLMSSMMSMMDQRLTSMNQRLSEMSARMGLQTSKEDAQARGEPAPSPEQATIMPDIMPEIAVPDAPQDSAVPESGPRQKITIPAVAASQMPMMPEPAPLLENLADEAADAAPGPVRPSSERMKKEQKPIQTKAKRAAPAKADADDSAAGGSRTDMLSDEDDDDADLDRIKSDMNKILAKIAQSEVE